MLFAFILPNFFDLLSLQHEHPLPWSESELTIPGTKVPSGNLRSQERKFPGTFVPESEGSQERKYRGAKSPDTGTVQAERARVHADRAIGLVGEVGHRELVLVWI